jgi:hypothetical protein
MEKSEKEKIGEVTKYTNKIEEMLVNCGADEEQDFFTKINFIASRLHPDIVDKLHDIRMHRNGVVHAEYNPINFNRFQRDCKIVENELKRKEKG